MEIWVHRNGQYAGRFSESAIREKVADGSLSGTDLAWDEAKAAWKPISEFLATLTAAKLEPESAVAAAAASEVRSESSSNEESKERAGKAEGETSATAPVTPPPLPSIAAVLPATPMPAAGPPPLPSVMPGPASSIPATTPPVGETIWSPVMAILGSLVLTPAFGGFIIWRNWVIMKRRRRALVAAPWFWIGFVVLGLAFYSPNGITLIIWIAYTLAWIAFSAFPQIRYVQTSFKREKTRWGLPLIAALVLWGIGFTAFHFFTPEKKTTLAPSPEQPTTTAPQQLSVSHDRVFTAEELRDIYKSSVLEVRTTWKEKRSTFNKKDNGASGTGVLLYNDSEYGLVATNWHVVDPGENMTSDYKCGVRFSHDKEFADVEVVARAKNDVDLALLLVRLEGKWAPNQFPIRKLDAIKEGEACIAIGNALGEGLSITAGIISRFDKVKEETLIRTSTPVSPGNSGGPLILNRGGSLAGIITLQSRITNVQNVNFATPAQYLLDKEIWDFESGQDKAQELLDHAISQAKK
ncbi:MAG TPA: trypsin-like peptidase domain-containing protein [Chthoniobacterales bacterium]|nr:trypsin-like peptidase domain-containing protein [Chthoniobacterales bacterium]